jgi:hypothetical protein
MIRCTVATQRRSVTFHGVSFAAYDKARGEEAPPRHEIELAARRAREVGRRYASTSCVRTYGVSLETGAWLPFITFTHSMIDAVRITTTDTRKKPATAASR